MDQAFKRLTHPAPWMWQIAIVVLAIVLPYLPFMDRSRTSLAVYAGIYVMLGLSLNIIVGYAGLFQLGHAAFFGLGAYTAAILSIEHNISILATIPLAALVAGVLAVVVFRPILHLRGDYLCIVTIAFGEIFRISMTNNIFGITGGSNGLFGAGRPELPLPWVEPVPVLVLIAVLAVHVYSTRAAGPALRWGGTVLLAVVYYLPLALDQKQLFVLSILMGIAALIVGAALRAHGTSLRGQIAGLVAVAGVFALVMLARGDSIVSEIDYSLDEYFRVQDPTTILGIEWTPVAFKRDALPYYYLVLAFIALTVVGMRRLQNSRLGRAWLYVREDQLAAEAMGIDTTQVKLAALAIGSAWAGVAGVLYASRFTVVAPESFNFLQSVIMFCIVVLGGSGSIPGVLVGTLGMVVLPELLRDVGPTFLYKGSSPVILLAVILGLYLYSARKRPSTALIESGAAVIAFLLPSLLLNEPALRALGLAMALAIIVISKLVRRRTENARPWVLGAVAVYTVAVLAFGHTLGPDLEEQISGFRIMDWRDGLMGAAMVIMMVLRPAGIIPERRQGVVMSAVVDGAETGPRAAIQPTL